MLFLEHKLRWGNAATVYHAVLIYGLLSNINCVFSIRFWTTFMYVFIFGEHLFVFIMSLYYLIPTTKSCMLLCTTIFLINFLAWLYYLLLITCFFTIRIYLIAHKNTILDNIWVFIVWLLWLRDLFWVLLLLLIYSIFGLFDGLFLSNYPIIINNLLVNILGQVNYVVLIESTYVIIRDYVWIIKIGDVLVYYAVIFFIIFVYYIAMIIVSTD